MPARKTPPIESTPVAELWNLSALTGSWLEDLGLRTYADLVAADLPKVWLRLRAEHRQVTRLMYYALWGAVHNVRWDRIPEEEKARFEAAILDAEPDRP